MRTEKISLRLEVKRGLRNQLQRDRLSSFLAELEKEHGSIDPEVIEAVRQEWPIAEEPTECRSFGP